MCQAARVTIRQRIPDEGTGTGTRVSARHLELARAAAAIRTPKLVSASPDLFGDDPEDPNINYLATIFTRTSLPYSKLPDDLPAWVRRNGRFVMVVQPGMTQDEKGNFISLGYPYGVIPRLLIVWLCTQIVRHPEYGNIIPLGKSLGHFLRQLGMSSSGGPNGTITRLREQARRLFEANISTRIEGDPSRDAGLKLNVATMWNLVWDDSGEEQTPLFTEDGKGKKLSGYIEVDPKFLAAVQNAPMPIHEFALRMLRRSAFAMDLYFFITMRMFTLSKPVTISWEQLRLQFGSGYAANQEWKFRTDFKKHLDTVKLAYPEAQVESSDHGLLMKPSPTSVPTRAAKTLRKLTAG